MAIGLGMGFVAIWWERYHQLTFGKPFALNLLDRVLVASHAVWFYAGKLVWPANLTFSYPRWTINPADPFAYGWLLAGIGVGGIIYFLRRWTGRSVEVAMLFYVATLGPMLGFIMLYTFRYSFVADHYQYVASIGPLALAAAGINLMFSRFGRGRPFLKPVFCGVLLLVLGTLTWRQCRMYKNMETLWRTTIARNPRAFLAYNDLAVLLIQRGEKDQALTYIRKAVEIRPHSVDAIDFLGTTLLAEGRANEAIGRFREALRLAPDDIRANVNIGSALLQTGQPREAIKHLNKALRLDPDNVPAHYNLGSALAKMGQLQEAIKQYQAALQLQSDFPIAQCELGITLTKAGQPAEAIPHFEQALQSEPNYPKAYNGLGLALLQSGKTEEAITQFRMALLFQPDFAEAHDRLGDALLRRGRELFQKGQMAPALADLQEGLKIHPDNAEACQCLGRIFLGRGRAGAAVAQFQTVLKLQPNDVEAQKDLAWIWATCPDAAMRNGVRAVELAQRANQLSGGHNPVVLGTLAAAEAETGRFPKAITTAHKALQLAESQTNAVLVVNGLRAQIMCYEKGAPFRDSSLTNTPVAPSQ